MPALRVRDAWAMPGTGVVSSKTRSSRPWLSPTEELQTLDLLLTSGSLPLTLPMDSTQKLIQRLVERRMQVTGESRAVATANVMSAFEKLRRNKPADL